MRQYQVDAIPLGNYHAMFFKEIASRSRIKPVLLHVFRRFYGRAPSEYWAQDGFMGQAWDRRGNRVEIHQLNKWIPFLTLDHPHPVKRPCMALVRRAARATQTQAHRLSHSWKR